jgi:hypothetical protein
VRTSDDTRRLGSVTVATMATIDLTNDDSQTWMNQVRAERVKGAPLTEAERGRIRGGRAWDDAASDAAQDAPAVPTAARWRFPHL